MQRNTDQELEENAGLAGRIQSLELDSSGTVMMSGRHSPIPTALIPTWDLSRPQKDATIVSSPPDLEDTPQQDVTPELAALFHHTFNEALAVTRAYRRVDHLEMDCVSTLSSTRSHGWSALSGISSSQISSIGVMCLPLYDTELARFRSLAFPKDETLAVLAPVNTSRPNFQ